MAESDTELSYAGSASSADLTVNGLDVTVGPLTVTMDGFDLTGSQAECVLGRGVSGTPGGSTDFGFTDTTYALTAAQIQAGSMMGA
jgi:hypothetical protein